jgi:peptide/nickel transport system substrate-binding protein
MRAFVTVAALTAAALLAAPFDAVAQTRIEIGLQDDPGSLDPMTNNSFVGRIVLQSVCDKLVDIDPQGAVVPMLAERWEWADDGRSVTFRLRPGVRFHDDTPVDAAAVRATFERYLTTEASRRRPEIAAIDRVEAIDPGSVRLVLKQPSVPLLAQLTDRAGMITSPTALARAPGDFATRPVCAGPYKVAEYRAQDRVVLDRSSGHWRASAYAFDRVVFRPQTDSNVRLVNLRAGQLDLVERVAPGDIPAIEADRSLRVAVGAQPAFQILQFNLAGPAAQPDIARSAVVRAAIDRAIDRAAINQVVFDGRYDPGNQPFPPGSPWYDPSLAPGPRDVAAARAMLREAGVTSLAFDVLVPTDPERQQVAQILQAMLAEAGIRMNIVAMEFVSLLARARTGDFQAYIVGSSGRVDPDLNISLFVSCGTANNNGKYCNPTLDGLLAQGRAVSDVPARQAIYRRVVGILREDLPVLYLYNPRAAFAHTARLNGFVPYPDGIIRLEGVTLAAR